MSISKSSHYCSIYICLKYPNEVNIYIDRTQISGWLPDTKERMKCDITT